MANIIIGTSGWMYKHWDKKFYPSDVKDKDKLAYISNHYKTLEVNTSFYHFVRKATFEKWYQESAPGFIFSVKGPRYYTHMERLLIDDDILESMKLFFDSIQPLKEKLGCVLFQLPGSFREKKDRLEEFLSKCDEMIKDIEVKPDIAFEFRHESWFNEEVYKILEKYKTALVIANSSKYPFEIRTTADFSYMRFHGPAEMFLGKYSDEQLEYWKKEIDKFSKKLKKVYIYFNNDLEANAVENADTLIELFNGNS